MQKKIVMRSAFLVGYRQLALSLALDVDALARRAGLRPGALRSPDATLRARHVYRLLEMSAAISRTMDFGLRLANGREHLSYLGTLGALMRDEPDVRAALHRLARDLTLHSTASSLSLNEAAGTAVLQLDMLSDGEPAIRQATECAIRGSTLLLRGFFAPGWRPRSIQFVHQSAGVDRVHRDTFGCPVRFGAESNAIVFERADLDRPIPLSDRALRRYARTDAVAVLPGVGRLRCEARARPVMVRLLPEGRCSADAVASELGMDRRTLHRRLAAEGDSYSQLLHKVRLELAQQYLSASMLQVAEIAGLLGFDAATSFARWFAERTGSSPTRWRGAL